MSRSALLRPSPRPPAAARWGPGARIAVILLALSSARSALAAPPIAVRSGPRAVIAADLDAFGITATQKASLLAELDRLAQKTARELAGSKPDAIAGALWRQVAKNLEAKRALPAVSGRGLPLGADELRRTVFGYEAFKLATYATAGVFPKRYFGYFDLKWDTAPDERRLREVVHGAVGTLNAALHEQGSPVRLTDAEIAVTFLAEGGAILLREDQAKLNDVHPVYGIGLDDLASGVKAYPALVARLDAQFGTSLHTVVIWREGTPYLARNFTYEEAILGTALMWTFEKERAERMLRDAGRQGLEARDLDDQFILSSLVYNSGVLFDDSRIAQLRRFETAGYLAGVSQANAHRRGALPVEPPPHALTALLASGEYPVQLTSWSAVYHVLQRWGALAALERFTEVFDAHGMFRA
jgi:hypothetical protein